MGAPLIPYGMSRGTALVAKVGMKRDGGRAAQATATPTMVQVSKDDQVGRKVRRLK